MFVKELYNIINCQGMEYLKNPETRSQIIKITFMVVMKLISMVRNRVSKNKKNDEHIDCNCKNCKMWKAKMDDLLKKSKSEKSKYEYDDNSYISNNSSTTTSTKKRKIVSSIIDFINRKLNKN